MSKKSFVLHAEFLCEFLAAIVMNLALLLQTNSIVFGVASLVVWLGDTYVCALCGHLSTLTK